MGFHIRRNSVDTSWFYRDLTATNTHRVSQGVALGFPVPPLRVFGSARVPQGVILGFRVAPPSGMVNRSSAPESESRVVDPANEHWFSPTSLMEIALSVRLGELSSSAPIRGEGSAPGSLLSKRAGRSDNLIPYLGSSPMGSGKAT